MAWVRTMRSRWALAVLVAWAAAGCERPVPATGDAPAEGPVNAPPNVVLASRLAGSWYPADPEKLRRDLDDYLARADAREQSDVRALILPHAGYAYSGTVAAHGLHALGARRFARVVVIGPSHTQRLENRVSLPEVTHYGTPLGDVPLDLDFIETLLEHDEFVRMPEAHDREHSVQIEVPLLQHVLGSFELVPLVVGALDLDTTRRVAEILSGLVDTDTLVVASTDFTHYGERFHFVPFTTDISDSIRALDMGAWEHIRNKDERAFSDYCRQTGATICGRYPVGVLLAMLKLEDEVTLLAYDQSGRMGDDFRSSVSYLAAAVTGPSDRKAAEQLNAEEKEALLQLARDTLGFVYRERRVPEPHEVSLQPTPAMREACGAFVTLHRDGALRGCIGDLDQEHSLYEAVMRNAVSAALRDRRFQPVREDELDLLHIEISALTPMRPVDSYLDFEPGRHGIVLTKHGRSAVFLPQVATDQAWNREETLTHLAQKAGLPGDAWRSDAQFQVFEALVFGENEE